MIENIKAETRKQKKWKQETGSGRPEKIVRELREFLEIGQEKTPVISNERKLWSE